MGLKKAITRETGHTNEYHRITSHEVDQHGQVVVRYASYKDKTCRDAGASPDEQWGLAFQPEELATFCKEPKYPTASELYAILKTTERLAKAEDVLEIIEPTGGTE